MLCLFITNRPTQIYNISINSNLLQYFYHPMLRIAPTMPSQDVRPSVRPSVCLSVCHTPVLCQIKTATYIFKLFSPLVATPFEFIRTKRHGNIPTKPPPSYPLAYDAPVRGAHNGGVECKGLCKNHDFRPMSHFISETNKPCKIES